MNLKIIDHFLPIDQSSARFDGRLMMKVPNNCVQFGLLRVQVGLGIFHIRSRKGNPQGSAGLAKIL
jgi:hypothetical protein